MLKNGDKKTHIHTHTKWELLTFCSMFSSLRETARALVVLAFSLSHTKSLRAITFGTYTICFSLLFAVSSSSPPFLAHSLVCDSQQFCFLLVRP